MSHGLVRAGSSTDEATARCHALDTCEAGMRSKRDTCERIVSKRSPWRGGAFSSSSTTIFFVILLLENGKGMRDGIYMQDGMGGSKELVGLDWL